MSNPKPVVLMGSKRVGMTCSPKTDPATMRVRPLQRSRRRTLYGQTTLSGADHPQAPGCGGEASWQGNSPGGCHRARHQRGYVPPLEESLRRDELQRGQAPQGARKGEHPPEEAGCRAGSGHRHPQGSESKKLLSPARRRKAVLHVQKKFELSERRACQIVGQPRSTQRYVDRRAEGDRPLLERMVTLSGENPRYGYRRVWALLKREGWPVNKKRVHRLWREEGLRVPEEQRKRRRPPGHSENGCARKRAQYKDHVWSARLRDGPDRGRPKAKDNAARR